MDALEGAQALLPAATCVPESVAAGAPANELNTSRTDFQSRRSVAMNSRSVMSRACSPSGAIATSAGRGARVASPL